MRRTRPETASFPLAPMAGVIRWLTLALLPLPAAVFALGLVPRAPRGVLPVAGLLALVWAWVYLWYRPTRFEVGPDGLRIVWPVRSRLLPVHDLAGAEATTGEALRAERGLLLRVGAGGLFGGFGMLWSSRGRHLDFYVSRTDGLVLVHRRSGRPLLVTPARPESFVARVRALLGPGAGPGA